MTSFDSSTIIDKYGDLHNKHEDDPGSALMLHQESRLSMHFNDFYEAQAESLSLIAYQSTAVEIPSDGFLQELVGHAQTRNRALGITGVLVYERGAYFQWLEGPTDALQRVWASILRDPRHHHVTVLRDEPIVNRVFEGWDLRIAQGQNVSIEATVAAMESSNARLRRVMGRPRSLIDLAWEDIFATIVIPRLLAVHGRDFGEVVPLRATASIWHADPDSGARLAAALLSQYAIESTDFVDSLLERGAGFRALYQEVFEPAQLQLGKLWDQDQCNDYRLDVGLARLQTEIRRVNREIPGEYLHKPAHSVLLSTQPSEPHSLALTMSSEVFDRQGWEVMCQFPIDDQALVDVVQTQWFDVLKLSQSGSLRRDSRLTSIRATIDSARHASMNPSLIVMVDGRTFAERPQTYRAVHANASCVSALDAAPTAERLLDDVRSMTPLFSVSA